jgi:pimeloyl-ACP methyl ester carboxylesterase
MADVFFCHQLLIKIVEMRSEPREIDIHLPGIRLAALEWGRVGQPLVLALHGWMDNAASFVPLAASLSGCHIVAVDLAGHGRSEHRPPGVPYDLPGYLADILAVMDALGRQQVILLGHSLGAALGSILAASFPERVEKLVLIDGTGPLSADPAQAPERLRKAVRRRNTERSESRTRYADFSAAVKRRARRGAMSEQAAAHLVGRGTLTDAEGIRWCSDLRAAEPSPFYLTEEQVLAFIANVACPTLLIKAESGLLAASRTRTAERENAFADLTVVELSGSHHLHMETPEEIAEHVLRFIG